jgi:20S proteasome alpha/beta subunit
MIRPPEPFPLKPKRPILRKHMTIAIGFRSNDGALLCADTQLSLTGGIKTYDGKVHIHIFQDSSNNRIVLGIAGSGDSDYISMATGKLTENFPDCENLTDLSAKLEERWLDFFNKHIAPWAYFPRDDRPYVELLIAVSGIRIQHALFHCTGTAFYKSDTKAIGTGILLADEMLHRYAFGIYSLEQLSVLAVYIMAKVKHSVDGCGGSTQFMALRKGGDFALSEKKEITQLEGEILSKEITQLEGEILSMESAQDKSFVDSILKKSLPMLWFSDVRKKRTRQAKQLNSSS